MKRKLLVALALGAVLVAARLPAGEPTTPKMVTPDWHYRWHEGRWWYWTADSKWDYWNGSAWIRFELPSSVRNVSAETDVAAKTAEPVYPIGPICPVDSSNSAGYSAGYSSGSGYSVGSGGGYAGYGWSWGPGTAFRDSPGRGF